MRKSPRQRRLEADFRSVEQLDAESTVFSFLASGDPPNRYRLQFTGPGICKNSYGEIHITRQHEVIVELGAAYPRMVPNLLWQSPIFHPNISNNGVVCLGGYGTHWVPSLTLDEMSTMLWDMIRYENYDIQSPYNREAALWARDQNKFKFPLDGRDIRDRLNTPPIEFRAPPSSSDSKTDSANSNTKKATVIGAIGNLAERFRNRPSNAANAAENSPAAERVLLDPSEIEIVEDGITFLEPDETETVATPNPPTVIADVENEPEEDAGITFLD